MGDSKVVCSTPGCNKPTTLLCPVCKGFGVNSWFCSQECFKSVYKKHKLSHQLYAETHSAKVGVVSDKAFLNFNFTGPLRPGEKSAKRRVPNHIDTPDYAEGQIPHSERQNSNQMMKRLNEIEIKSLRETSRLGREVLDLAIAAAKVGVTTEEIDTLVFNACIERNCYPSPLNYYGFPKSCCTSLNEVICHGIPDSRPLEDGDILNIDITTYFDKYHGDLNETIFIGKPSDQDVRLVKCTYDCLANSMDCIKPGLRYQEVGAVIEKRATEDNFSVVRTYCGHGLHKLFHCLPNVPHYKNNRAPGKVEIGHSFTIEPMINVGVYEDVTWPDKWTAVTKDGKRSAQFEHTMVVTTDKDERSCAKNYPGGPPIEVMTKRTNLKPLPVDAVKLLSKEDIKHFEMYGRPHFIDQLVEMKYDLSKLY